MIVRISDAHLDDLRHRGYLVVEGFLSPTELAEARDDLWRLYPHPDDYFADPRPTPGSPTTSSTG